VLQVYVRIGVVRSAVKHVFTGVAHSPSNLHPIPERSRLSIDA
jgi:hypothetical protein